MIDIYTGSDLDAGRVEQLQAEIFELRRRPLSNYHRMQMGLRKVTGRERSRKVEDRKRYSAKHALWGCTGARLTRTAREVGVEELSG